MASLGEFEFIDQLIKAHAARGQTLFKDPNVLGIGDDCALLPPVPKDHQLAVSTDMLIETRHYFAHVNPHDLGHKVLAVNLSDLAAMGATPIAFTLAAGLKKIDVPWMTAFIEGLLQTARDYQCALIGGDTTRTAPSAPDVFSVTIFGSVPMGAALRRDALAHGHDLWVSGRLGDCAHAVRTRIDCEKLARPTPRIALGQRLLGIAGAAIDISDGLLSEVMHLLKASSAKKADNPFSATLFWDALPLGPMLQSAIQSGAMSEDDARVIAATGGDEYELLFSAPANRAADIKAIAKEIGCEVSRIGTVHVAATDLATDHTTPADAARHPSVHWVRGQATSFESTNAKAANTNTAKSNSATAPLPLDSHLVERLSRSGFDHFKG